MPDIFLKLIIILVLVNVPVKNWDEFLAFICEGDNLSNPIFYKPTLTKNDTSKPYRVFISFVL